MKTYTRKPRTIDMEDLRKKADDRKKLNQMISENSAIDNLVKRFQLKLV